MQLKLYIPDGLCSKHPYVYIIRHLESGLFYVGSKFEQKSCDSSLLMTECGYQTSSSYVKDMIKLGGVKSFEVIRIRHFSTKNEAIKYEHKFLTKVDAMKNDKFINRSNGALTFTSGARDGESRLRSSKAQIGRKFSEIHKQRLSDAWKKRPSMSLETKDKIRKGNFGRKWSNETRKKLTGRKRTQEQIENMKAAQHEIAKKPNSLETRNRKRIASLGKVWWTNKNSSVRSIDCPGAGWVRGRK